tara:strand:+ start:3491 stop:4270 length:780 start_codon:yes stop_codon:yes gene_type:complete
MNEEQGKNRLFSSDYYVKKYSEVRNKRSDLFESEKYFIPRCLSPGKSLLDIGCAVGGFSEILHDYEETIEYFGVDVSEEMIIRAKEKYPDLSFRAIDCVNSMEFEDSAFHLVQSWGVTVHEPEYRELLKESWRVCSEILIFDMRLKMTPDEYLDKEVSYTLNPGGVKYHYVVANIYDFIQFLIDLKPVPGIIEMYGYEAAPNKFSFVPEDFGSIFMFGIAIYKNNNQVGKSIDIKLNVPDGIRKNLEDFLTNKDVSISG